MQGEGWISLVFPIFQSHEVCVSFNMPVLLFCNTNDFRSLLSSSKESDIPSEAKESLRNSLLRTLVDNVVAKSVDPSTEKW